MRNMFRFALSILAISAITLSACNTDPEPGVAEVKVIDEEGVAQENIKVRMYCTGSKPGCVVNRVGRTNTLGVYTESFELPVVLRVRAVRYDTTRTTRGLPPNERIEISVDSLCGEGFVQVENDEIVSEVITILECK